MNDQMNNNQPIGNQTDNNQVNVNQNVNNQANVNQNVDQMQKTRKDNENKGRGLFFGVIAVATFIVMAVGATFAYFTATTNSGDDAVKTGSTTLQLKYISYGAGWMNRDLIPADTNVVEYSFENQSDATISDADTLSNALCKDDFGNSICSAYVFQVYNGANSPQSVSIDVVSENNSFYNLYSMAYELSIPTDQAALDAYNNTSTGDPKFRKTAEEEGDDLINVVDNTNQVLYEGIDIARNQYTPVYLNRGTTVKTLLKHVDKQNGNAMVPSIAERIATVGEPSSLIPEKNLDNLGTENVKARSTTVASNIEIEGGKVRTFALVLYIKNEQSDQTIYDVAKTFTGRIVVGSGDGSTGVSGSISATLVSGVNEGLQSNQG